MTDYKTSNSSATNLAKGSAAHSTPYSTKSATEFHIEEDESFSYQDYKIEDWLAFILFWLLALTVFSQFVSRYIFSAPLGWTEEIARYQLICLGFIGSCIGIRKNSHIFVALFHHYIPLKLSQTLYQLIAVFNLVFIACLAFFAWQIMPKLHIHKMASIDMPISVLYGIIFGSLLIMLMRSGQFLFQAITKPEQLTQQQLPKKIRQTAAIKGFK